MASKTCTHIKVTGVRCGSPALYGEQFCYFHQHAHRGVRKPQQSRLHPIAILEDEESIQASLMEVINALMRNTIDLKRAELILRALHIAVKNARRAKFDNDATRVVREVPEYAEPPAPPVDPTAPRKYTAQEIEALKEQILAEHLNSKQQPVPAHVAAAAPAHPRGPEATVRSAANSNPATLSTHDFKKPPQTAPQAPKERKNAAHRASGG